MAAPHVDDNPGDANLTGCLCKAASRRRAQPAAGLAGPAAARLHPGHVPRCRWRRCCSAASTTRWWRTPCRDTAGCARRAGTDGTELPDEAVIRSGWRANMLQAARGADAGPGRGPPSTGFAEPGLSERPSANRATLAADVTGPARGAQLIEDRRTLGRTRLTWHAIRTRVGERFTSRHYLNAVDLQRLPDGSIAPPAAGAAHLPDAVLADRGGQRSLITVALPAARLPGRVSHRPRCRHAVS